MGPTKYKPLRIRNFLGSLREIVAYISKIFFPKQLQGIEHYFFHQIFKHKSF